MPFNLKHKIYEFRLFLKVFYFVSKGSYIITEFRCLLIDRVLQLYTLEHVEVNTAY